MLRGLFLLLFAFPYLTNGQTSDSIRLPYRFPDSRFSDFKRPPQIFLPNPGNVKKTVEFDPLTRRYILQEKIGEQLYKAPRYLTIDEYQRYINQEIAKDIRRAALSSGDSLGTSSRLIPALTVENRAFERIFGGSVITIRPQGTADVTIAGNVNKNGNPLLTERQRKQFSVDLDQRIQMNVVGQVGSRLRIATNYNSEAQFDFENQIKIDKVGNPDDILQRIEIGNVSLPLNSTLITGSQALFGVKTQMQFGRLNVTSVFSQQKSQHREITVANGSQQNEFRLSADNYEANRHYFLAHFFRNEYNAALDRIPLIRSNINVTKVEVWITNRTNSSADSRDVLALMDLGENMPYRSELFQGGQGYSRYPAGTSDAGFPQQSNNLLEKLPQDAVLSNSNAAYAFFQGSGGTDNYSRLSYARKLTDQEYVLHPRLGYISLNFALNGDEVLAVAYRYTVNGVEYQVGQFASDVPVNPNEPRSLLAKLLKNENLKTSLPTWDLMMKNIYSLGAYQISKENFKLNIYRLDENTGVERPQIAEGQNNGKLWLQLTHVDQLNQANDTGSDGIFDFIEGITVDPQYGRITFPLLEPFGSDLATKFLPAEQNLIDKYVFKALYDSTRTNAQQLFQKYNRYIIRGTYQSEVSSEFQLNATNVPEGAVQVVAGTLPLVEGTDFTVDYTVGRVRILNEAMLNSGQPIRIKVESNELFGFQQRSLFGSRLDYTVSDRLQVGGTFMSLSEKPLSAKVNVGEEPISNRMWGVDATYSSESRWLTHLVNKLPFINTREISTITVSGEYAKLIPGHSKALDFAGSRGVSYLDDFEGTRSVIDLKSAIGWQISGTPKLFPEAELSNDLSYGFNRARLAFYNIDPVFYRRGSSLASAGLPNSADELSNHYVRQIFEQEVFPLKQSVTGIPLALPTLDLAFYPMIRGPYNYSTDVNADGALTSPRSRWGGLFRKLESTDFEAQNVEYVELWMLDPFIYKPDSKGGDLYVNLGNISEDILKDGRKSLENGLPVSGSEDQTELTKWGRVPKRQPVNQAFENSSEARRIQDVGLDGLADDAESRHFSDFVNQIIPRLGADVARSLAQDPSSDNFQYYRDAAFDNANAGILRRYERYNNTEGNSRTADQSLAETGLSNAASTSLPDGEDINRDNNMSLTDEYYQYKVSIRPEDMIVGQNFISDKVTSTVKLANGSTQQVSWYQFRIPISQYQQRVGGIEDFKSIRFMRVFLTDFQDSAVIRLAKLQLVRGEWRKYNSENNPVKVLADPALGTSPGMDNSSIEVSTINIEENGKRTPIPYVVPPGIIRERDLSSYRGDAEQNEQSLSIQVSDLRDGYARAAFKTAHSDFRSYGKLEMFIHAEGEQLRDKELSAIIRIGTDNQDNYYEYEIPLDISSPGTNDAYAIWPESNKLDLEFKKLQAAKVARNRAKLGDLPWPANVPFEYADGLRTIRVVGQPDLSKVRIYMLGVKNPLRRSGNSMQDDGLDKSAQVWFNELRLSEFDERGGWAATARLNARLADFAEVSVSGSKSTVGFGSIDRRTSERNRSDDRFFDLASTLELGRFFPRRAGMQIPVFLNWSSQVSVPQYDPSSQDIELNTALSGLSKVQRDSVHRIVDDYTRRRSINFNNVRKIKTNPADKLKLWDIENWSASYAYNEYDHRDFINEKSIQKTYRASLAYNYTNKPQSMMPLAKIIKSNQLSLLRDINFNLLPSLLNFRIDVDRLYSENSLRNNDPANVIPLTTFNKNFRMSRLYGISWSLTRSLQMDFNATNYSIIDEPQGRINGIARDTIWENLKRLGRTTDYDHNLNFTYNLPINKIPALNWTTAVLRYGTSFNWTTESTNTLRDPEISLGNSIQNSRTIQLNPSLNFSRFYNKFSAFRRSAKHGASFSTFLKDLLTGVKSMTGAYTLSQGTFLPGYTPGTNVLGYDLDENAPGWGFLLGSQQDIRSKAVVSGWITRDTLLNQLYVKSKKEDISIRATIEPLKDLRIELTATKSSNFNYSTNFRFNSAIGDFESQSPITSGDFSISFASIRTAFSSIEDTGLFREFERNRSIVSERLGTANPNSQGVIEGYSEGYGKNSQDVVVASFLAAYTGKSPESVSLRTFPKIPVPNWRVSYNGLTKYALFNSFASFNLNHSYRSTYNVNGFSSLVRYQEQNGSVSVKDGQGNYLPIYQFSQVMLFEQFVPLIGVDFRLKNNVSANFEYRKTRGLSLSLVNSQLAQQQDDGIIFGFGYRSADFRFPFGLLSSRKTKNDVNFKLDFAVNDRKTVIYRADIEGAEVYSGAKNVALRPSIDYLLNQRLNIRLFYDGSLSKPYTSQAFNTSFSNFGINMRFTVQ
ncbi:cell surface protein SprA [Arcticibacter sp.]|uniref:T9SS outer membrane translocon Sov/SprA n=1 Tax=Arcticibacter sp. TaxID=1872630 RepID=UPI00388F5A37